MKYNEKYCLLCDKILKHSAHQIHNKHRYEGKYWKYITYCNDSGDEVLLIFDEKSNNNILYEKYFYINWKDDINLFKKAKTLEKAQAIVNKLKVFK